MQLNAVMIELFIRGIISLTLPLFTPPLLPPFRPARVPLPRRLSPFPDTSFHISRPFDVLSLFAIFRTFPRRVFHVTPGAASLRYFRDAVH